MYEPLIQGLTSLVQHFPKGKLPTFLNHAHRTMQSPFALCDEEQHETKPDVIATVPGLPCIPPTHRWRHVALVFEAKSCDSDDPMETITETHEETLVQLAKSARNIMLAQGRLFAFVVGIYGHKARIFRFDRAGAVCSPLFNYVTKPEILHEFLWRFLNPKTKGCVVVGDDPTSNMGTRKDRARVQKLTQKYDPFYKYTAENRKAVRRFKVTHDKGVTEYLAYKLIFVNPRLFSRATTIWEAFELNKKGEGTGKRVVIKEAWRQFARPSEIGFYRAMREAADEAEEGAALSLSGVADFEYGDDLGLREAMELDKIARRDASGTSDDDNTPAASFSEEPNDPDAFPRLKVPYWQVLGHRTVTARCRDAIHEHNERGHVRLVLNSIGTPITEFESTYELVRALRDAIEGHRQAYLAGIVHRDISKGNVMIARRIDGPSSGFIHDLDYACSWKRFLASKGKSVNLESWKQHARGEYAPIKQRILENMMRKMNGGPAGNDDKKPATTGDPKVDNKQRTGTLHFMAVEVLSGHVTHEARHDLESFYWLLVWIVLRHTAFIHPNGEWAWHELFGAGTIASCCTLKESWLKRGYTPVMVMQNMPLTTLLEEFRQLCKTNFDNEDLKKQCMTHEDVLNIFNKALENPGAWPQDDRAKPWTLPKSDQSDQVPGMEERSGQARTKGTLTYTSAAASRSASRLGARLQPKKRPESPPAPSTSKAQPNEEHTDTDTAESDVDESDRGPAKRTARSRSAGKRRVAGQHTSTTMSHASGSNEVPPSSGSESLKRHRSGYALRSVQTTKVEDVRQSARSTSRKMGPPPAPRTRSGGSQSQSASRPISAQGVASKRGSSATKRTRARGGDVEVEDDAGASHSSKRQRKLSQPETGQGSQKSRVRR
ncbi:uncharacterized protein B0H18DRAFT_910291 [Fomitopsis serialis]|uniref:uncharacterized protein n=1 Tax=Fomitopsis serialis TaxID=139415 RepID=UPI0020088EB1|nr:uncharacterized protein B0H18DRAFT_910291 [Neoantrodia serialis]KAH9922502.1 hypothetical protein B0H18DRAFT_910291 [Neoantrodia serialis]